MTSPSIDPLRLNAATFAADGQELDGDWAIASLPRLAASECPADVVLAKPGNASSEQGRRVRWRAVGSERREGGVQQPWLWLRADADVVLQCQRCLLPIDEAVHVDRQFRFVADEATAAALDDEIEDDVLVMQKFLNLRELVEDEMLLALPLVPRHAVCPEPLPMSFGDVEIVESEAAHPFAALALLRKDTNGDPEIG